MKTRRGIVCCNQGLRIVVPAFFLSSMHSLLLGMLALALPASRAMRPSWSYAKIGDMAFTHT